MLERLKKGREDDDINCVAIPSEYVEEKKIQEMVKVMLETEF